MALVVQTPPQLGFWKELGDGIKFVANVATAPIRLPVEMVKAVAGGATAVIGATGNLVGQVAQAPGQIIAGLRPAPQRADPGLVAALGLGGGGGKSSLTVPLLVGGGILAVGALVFVLARKKRGGG